MKNFNECWGIPKPLLSSIIEVIKRRIKVKQLILFGSRAKGNFRNGSDVDIAIVGDFLRYEELNKVRVDLSELNLPFDIDLLDYDSITDKDLIEHITRIGIVLE